MEIDAQCQHLTSICTHTIMQCVATCIAPTFMQTDTHSTQIKYTSGDNKNEHIFQIPFNIWFFVLSSFSIYPFDLQFSFDIVLLGTHTYCPLHHTHPLYFWLLGAIFRGAIRSRVNPWTWWHWVLSLGDVNHVISTSFSTPTGDIGLSALVYQWAGLCWVEMPSPVSFLSIVRGKNSKTTASRNLCFDSAEAGVT